MIGARCRIVGTTLDGVVVGVSKYVDRMDRFDVRYVDAIGNPQERRFTGAEISFDGREAEGNVIYFERRVA
jgi:hypothetical protein